VEATDEPAVFYQLSREVKVFAESGGFLGTEEYRVRTAQGGDDVLTFRQWYAGAGIARKAGPGYLSLRAGRLFLRRFRTHEAPLEIKLRNGLYIALGLDLEY
jgi:hypothetical protein